MFLKINTSKVSKNGKNIELKYFLPSLCNQGDGLTQHSSWIMTHIPPYKKGQVRFRKVPEKQNFDTKGTVEELIFRMFKWNYKLYLWKTQTSVFRLVYRKIILPTKAEIASAEGRIFTDLPLNTF